MACKARQDKCEGRYDLLAVGLREHLDVEKIYRILEKGLNEA